MRRRLLVLTAAAFAAAASAVAAPLQLADGVALEPPAGWALTHRSADELAFVRADEAHAVVYTASVSRAVVGPWRDASSFSTEIRGLFQHGIGVAQQHVTTDAVTALQVAGRPCVDLRRSGVVSADVDRNPEAIPHDVLLTREFVRACHLRDRARPGEAVVAVVKLTGAKDPGTLPATAQAFLAGLNFPGAADR